MQSFTPYRASVLTILILCIPVGPLCAAHGEFPSAPTFAHNAWKSTKKVAQEGTEWGKIIGASTLASVIYGIAQDQVTARICLEYFTQGFHKKMSDRWVKIPILKSFKTTLDNNPKSPTIQACIWGTVASWWVGAGFGTALAAACRIGSWPKIGASEALKPIMGVLAATVVSSAVAGIKAHNHFTGNQAAIDNWVKMHPYAIQGVSKDNQAGFIIDAHIHNKAYSVAALGSLACIGYLLYKRYEKQQAQD